MNDSPERVTPRLLLMVNGPIEQGGVGEIFLDAALAAYPRENLVRFSTVSRVSMASAAARHEGHAVYVHAPASVWPLFSSLTYWRFRRDAQALVDRAVAVAKHHQAQAVWAVLNSPGMIFLSHRVAKAAGLPLLVTIWDPPERFFDTMNLDPWTRTIVRENFEEALSCCSSITAASEPMRIAYRHLTSTDPMALIHGIPCELQRRTPKARVSDEFVIGFAGSLYAKREWNALLDAIDLLDGNIAGRPIVIRFIGKPPRVGVRNHRCVDHRGAHDLQSTIELLSEVDAGYLPYWMDKGHREVTSLCFPNKLSPYVAAGIPVLFHVPKGSSPDQFLAEYPVGLPCYSLQPRRIARTLLRFHHESEVVAAMAHARLRALDDVLGHDAMLRRFHEFIRRGTSQSPAVRKGAALTNSY